MEQRRWLLLALALLTAIPLSENFELTSPENVLGIVGQDAILPCTISSTKPLDSPEVRWIKITDEHTEDIYTYKQFGGEPRQKYPGRTSVPRDGFATGNVSLTLKNVQPADEGMYSCTVISKDWGDDTATKLSIAGTGEVFIEILGPQGEGLELGCRSHGWFPKPTVQWVTEDGQGLSADTEIQQDSRKLFSVRSRVTVTGEQMGKVTCQILNPLVQVEKKTTVSLSGALFPRVSPFVPAFWTMLTLFLLALVAGAVLVFRGRKKHRYYKERIKDLQHSIEFYEHQFYEGLHELQFYKGLYQLRFYKEVITLDADTAHPRLEITDRGVVKDTAVIRDVPNNEKRFDTELIVLAEEGYSTGKHFWKVDVGPRKSWALGVALESVTRKGPLTLSPENGFWVIGLTNGVDYWAYTDPWTRLKVSEELQEIGIFLDIPGKQVTFYDTIGGKALYTFSIADGSSKKRKFIPLFSTGPAAAEPDSNGLKVFQFSGDDD